MNNDLISDAIINSAKTKFDYSQFEGMFSETDEIIAENILIRIISNLAEGIPKEAISGEIFNQLLFLGLNWDLNDIDKFILEKESQLKLEIFATQLASTMLRDGLDTISVLNNINQLLN